MKNLRWLIYEPSFMCKIQLGIRTEGAKAAARNFVKSKF